MKGNPVRTLVLGLVSSVLLFQATGFAQTGDPKPVRVHLEVDAEDEVLRSELESYISRELRALGDVALVSDSTFALQVQVLATGQDPVALSTVVLRARGTDLTRRALVEVVLQNGKLLPERQHLPEEVWAKISRTVGSGDLLGQWVNLVSRLQLKSLCERLVADIDTRAVRTQREWLAAAPSQNPRN